MLQDQAELLIRQQLQLYKKIESKTRMTSGMAQLRKHYIELTITLDELFPTMDSEVKREAICLYQVAVELNKKIVQKMVSLRD
jgi:hypothetical protein